MSFNPRWIVGKRVAEVRMNASRDATGRVLHDPTIVFEDGSSIRFITEEDFDSGEYGVDIIYRKEKANAAPHVASHLKGKGTNG